MSLIDWACPGCGTPVSGSPARAGESCYRCEAAALWARLPEPVRVEFDELVRARRLIQAIAMLGDGSGEGLVAYRIEVLGLR